MAGEPFVSQYDAAGDLHGRRVAWNVDFLFGLLVGWHPLGATTYMFDERIPMFIRGMSFSHLVVPALLTWIVYKLRYDTRALAAQTLFSCIVLLLSYTLTDPASNINWVFGVGAQPQTYMPGWLYLAVVMMYVPVGFYLPIHLLLWKLGWHRIRQNKPAGQVCDVLPQKAYIHEARRETEEKEAK